MITGMKRARFWWGLGAVLLLAAAMRLLNAGEQSIWYDEWNGLSGMQQPTFAEAQRAQVLNHDMVPLYFAIQYYWVKITGHNLAQVRTVPIFFGVASVALLFLLGSSLHSIKAGFLAATLMAISPYNIQFSHELRPYSLMLFFALVSIYAVSKLLRDNRLRWWMLALASNVLLMWTHLFGFWLIVTQGLILLLLRPARLKELTAWTLAHVVLFIPIVLHMQTWAQMGKPPLDDSFIFPVISLLFMDASHLAFMPRMGLMGPPPNYARVDPDFVPMLCRLFIPLALLLAAAIVLALGLFLSQLRRSKDTAEERPHLSREEHWLLLLWFLAPTCLLYLFSVAVVPAFQVRYVLYSLPALYLIVVIAALTCRRPVLRYGLLTVFALPLALLGLLASNIPLRPDHQGAAQYVRSHWQTGGQLVVHPFNPQEAFCVALQEDDIPHFQTDRFGEALLDLDRVIENDVQGWFVLTPWTHEVATEQSEILEHYFDLRHIPFERRVYAGWWDIYVYRCWQGQGFRPLNEKESRDALVSSEQGWGRRCILEWVAAKAAEDSGAIHEARLRYQALLGLLPDDEKEAEQGLNLVGWHAGTVHSSLTEDFKFSITDAITSCEAKESAERAARAGLVYRFDDHVEESVAANNATSDATHPTKLVLWPSAAAWTTGAADSLTSEEDGAIHFVTKGRDGLTTPNGFEVFGPAVDAIVIDVEVTGTEKIYLSWRPADTFWDWCDVDGNLLIPIHVEQGKRNTYVVQVAGMPGWQHRRIDGMRLVTRQPAEIRLYGFRVQLRNGLFDGAPHGARPFRIGHETRPCLYLWAPGQLDYEVRIPESGAFTAGLAVTEEGKPVVFGVEVQCGEQTQSQTWSVERPEAWIDVALDLSPYAGQMARVCLSAKGKDGQVALWSNPQLAPAQQSGSRPPNILFYVVDSLRADHLGLYGYERDTSPRLDQFAKQGLVFDRFFSNETCTKPSMTTFHTGVDASVHGLTCTTANDAGELIQLPELLRKSGYETIAIVENPYTPPESNGRPAYSHIYDLNEATAAISGETYRLTSQVLERVKNRPFFLYVHTMECHVRIDEAIRMTYEAPPPFGGTFTGMATSQIDAYDDCILFADADFGRVLDSLDALVTDSKTLVVFTADHGEGFGAHEGRVVHGYEPYNELTHVPLLMRLPSSDEGGRRIAQNAQFVDLAPTLLDYAELAPCDQFRGLSLRNRIEQFDTRSPEFPVFGYTGETLALDAPRSLLLGDWKLLGPPANLKLFNILDDPDETLDLRPGQKDRFEKLKALFDEHTNQMRIEESQRPTAPQTTSTVIEPETEERLRALGYLKY